MFRQRECNVEILGSRRRAGKQRETHGVSFQQLLQLCFAIFPMLIFVFAGQCLVPVFHVVPPEVGERFFHVIGPVAQLCQRVGHSWELVSVRIWMNFTFKASAQNVPVRDNPSTSTCTGAEVWDGMDALSIAKALVP